MTSLMSLLLLFSGTEVTISEEPKMISAVEPVPGNEEIVQGTPFLTNMCPHTCTPRRPTRHSSLVRCVHSDVNSIVLVFKGWL
jgi:hypothetical protein